jgi:S-DNA-T family DNA segregation ATPase FtsK/SpoIIIE
VTGRRAEGEPGAEVVRGPWPAAAPTTAKPAAAVGLGTGPAEAEPDAVGVVVPGTGRPEPQPESRPRAAARAAARTTAQIALGHAVWARRAHDAATHAAIREQIRRTRAAGDAEGLSEWLDRLEAAKAARLRRIGELPAAIKAAAITGLVALAGLAAFLVVFGLLVAATGSVGWTWGGYWSFWADVLDVLAAVAVVALWAGVAGIVPAWLYAMWRAGRPPPGAGPAWALAPGREHGEAHAVVDAAGIAEALAHLGIPKLDKAIKSGWRPEFTLPPVRVNNRGYQAAFTLPMGVTPEMIADKREVLARNLFRHKLEVWPAAAEQAGVLELWVADGGSVNRQAPEYPLLHSGVCDIFAGVPLGVSQRGDVIAPALFEANMVFGGIPGQGKSNAARVVMLGAALDPLPELWVYVLANNGDFDAYAPRLARYERGVEDDVVRAAVTSLEKLYNEVGRREARLAELGAKKLTRRIAEKHPDMRPIVALYSECHEMFGYDKHDDEEDEDGPAKKGKKGPTLGELATEFATKLLRRARKVGIIVMFDTQSSRKEAIPPKVVELVKLNACFHVKNWRSNDGFLGDGSFQAGIRATELRADRDRGTSLLTGATSERFEIVRWYYIPADDDAGWDAATDVIARTVGVEAEPADARPERDELADIHVCMRGETQVRTEEMLVRLAGLDLHYRGWTFERLAAALRKHGLEAGKSNGIKVIRGQDVRSALTVGDGGGREEDE